MDTKGPELRSGFFANDVKKINLKKDQTVVLSSSYSFKGDATNLACSYLSLVTSVQPGQSILVADGSLVLTVLECNVGAGEVTTCRGENNNASIGERNNMTCPVSLLVDLPTLDGKRTFKISKSGEFPTTNIDCIAASKFCQKG
jgi:pyruvate kinase